ncbi:MAG: hypothetical protein MSS69_06740 [Spirochaetales bacterium]|nr:hypothetical protein [Spirochaetales bacterium]
MKLALIPANTEPSPSCPASSVVASKVTFVSVELLKPYDSSWKLYPRPTVAFPVKPANTVLAARSATNAIERIFFIISSIASNVIV